MNKQKIISNNKYIFIIKGKNGVWSYRIQWFYKPNKYRVSVWHKYYVKLNSGRGRCVLISGQWSNRLRAKASSPHDVSKSLTSLDFIPF